MNWLVTATRWWAVLGACVVSGLLAGLLRGATAAVPSLTQGALAPVPVVAVIALTPAVMLTWGWSRLPLQTLAGAARKVDLTLVAMVVVSGTTYASMSFLTGGVNSLVESGRNAAGLMGIALIGYRLLGERGSALLPVGYLVGAFALGRAGGSPTASWWAWILTDAGSADTLMIAAVLGAIGIALTPALPRAATLQG